MENSSHTALPISPPARATLDKNAWVHLATEILAEQGLMGLRVETLAKQLGVTKGSFYWHFKDRQALFDAVLETWRDGRIEDSARQAESAPGKAREQIRRVIDLYSINPNRKGMMIELAIRDWARREPTVAAAVEAVDRARLEHAKTLFVAAGFEENEAKTRALLLYTHSFGLSMMVYDHNANDITEHHRKVASLIVGLDQPET